MVHNTASPALRVSVEDIARRAYERYLQRGRADGRDRDDWRRAECELRAPAADSAMDISWNAPGTRSQR